MEREATLTRDEVLRRVLLAANRPDKENGLWRTTAEYAGLLGLPSRRVAGALRTLEHRKLVERTEWPEGARWASSFAAENAIELLAAPSPEAGE